MNLRAMIVAVLIAFGAGVLVGMQTVRWLIDRDWTIYARKSEYR